MSRHFHVAPSQLAGAVTIPGSKSHTIRGLILATLADGPCVLRRPLVSSDAVSCVGACRALGARVDTSNPAAWLIDGAEAPRAAAEPIDVGNSGTTLRLAMGVAALCEGLTEFTGDEQVRRRPAGPLLQALAELGATTEAKGQGGCAPLVVGGGLRGGRVTLECATSQYLSSLLIACPMASGATEIHAPLLNERPYVAMTCRWLRELGIAFEASADLQRFTIPGGQRVPAFDRDVPADFSSATFFLVAAAVTGSDVLLRGLDMADAQGDKAVVGMLREMGCPIAETGDGLRVRGPARLHGAEFDLNATPDALPALAVAGALAEGETRLLNVPQARLKETDRLAVMSAELRKMGADVDELADGLVIRGGALKGAAVDGHSDHRVVMALAVAGLVAAGTTQVGTPEAAAGTFPEFADMMRSLGARLSEAP